MRERAVLVTGGEPRPGRGPGRARWRARARGWCWWRGRRRRWRRWRRTSARRAARPTRSPPTSGAKAGIHARGRGGGAGGADRPAGPQREHAGADAAAAARSRHRVRGLRARARGQPAGPLPSDQGGRWARWRCAGAASSCTSPRTRRRGLPGLGRLRRVEGGARPPGADLGRGARGHGVRFLTVDPGEMDTAHARGRHARRGPRDARRSRGAWPRRSLELLRDAETPAQRRAGRGGRLRARGPPVKRRDRAARAGGDRLLLVDPRRGARPTTAACDDLPGLLRAGDLAGGERRGHAARLARGRTAAGAPVELRLRGCPGDGRRLARAAVRRRRLAHARRTARRRPRSRSATRSRSRRLAARVGAGLAATRRGWSTSASTARARALLAALYARGRPVQYSYLRAAARALARPDAVRRRGRGRPRCRPRAGR